MCTNKLSLNNLSSPSTSPQLNNLSPGLPPNILTPPTTPYSYNTSVLECYQNPPNIQSSEQFPSCSYPPPYAVSEPDSQWSADSQYAPVPTYFTFPPVAHSFLPSCAFDPRSKNIRPEDFLPPPTVTIHHHPTLPLDQLNLKVLYIQGPSYPHHLTFHLTCHLSKLKLQHPLYRPNYP